MSIQRLKHIEKWLFRLLMILFCGSVLYICGLSLSLVLNSQLDMALHDTVINHLAVVIMAVMLAFAIVRFYNQIWESEDGQ